MAASEWPLSMVMGVGVPAVVGLNVTRRPASSTAVHAVTAEHATPLKAWPASIVVAVGVPGADGLNVTCRPPPSTAVH